jgi:adenosine deaminase
MQQGVRTTLNTDDPGVMNVTLHQECENVVRHLGMTVEDLRQCNEWAREASFISKERIATVWP